MLVDLPCPCGGIGRRARLKIEFRKECWFDPGQGHHRLSDGTAKRRIQISDLAFNQKQPLNISFLPQDSTRLTTDKDKAERYNQWLKNLKNDIYLDQAVKVISDIQNQQNLAKGALKKETEAKSF